MLIFRSTILDVFHWLLSAASIAAACGILAAMVALVLKRWALALKIARVLTRGSVLVIAVLVAQFFVVFLAPDLFARDPSLRSLVIAEAASTALSCTATFMLMLIVAAAIGAFAARRVDDSRQPVQPD